MKRIKTASNIRFRFYTVGRLHAQERLAQITSPDLEAARQRLRQAPELTLERAA